MSETYNGWTNRETWAVGLHINNDQGWQESAQELLTEGPYGSEGFTLAEAREAFYNAPESIARMAGDIIRENVEGLFESIQSEPDMRSGELISVMQDIGSLWRVNWTELGASFLEDLENN